MNYSKEYQSLTYQKEIVAKLKDDPWSFDSQNKFQAKYYPSYFNRDNIVDFDTDLKLFAKIQTANEIIGNHKVTLSIYFFNKINNIEKTLLFISVLNTIHIILSS